MKEKPILFSTPMVQAILAGRKTMTRRVINPQPTYWDGVGERFYDKDEIVGPELYSPIRVGKDGEEYPGEEVLGIYSLNGEYGCEAPYKPGDVLWVRETWNNMCYGCEDCQHTGYQYRADGQPSSCVYDESWCPSIFMPRSAARLFLRVTDVRVEMVQEITTEDAKKEGAMAAGSIPYNTLIRNTEGTIPRTNFSILWDSLNAKRGYGWDTNPWVWVVEFERTDGTGK